VHTHVSLSLSNTHTDTPAATKHRFHVKPITRSAGWAKHSWNADVVQLVLVAAADEGSSMRFSLCFVKALIATAPHQNK
jgi:hypothetical protein